MLPEKTHLHKGLDRADSWSVDGHKLLQLPYDSGFAIVKNAEAHHRTMNISGGYLNRAPGEGRNPTDHNPELSRRARGFAAWAVLKYLGREGVRSAVRKHCEMGEILATRLSQIEGLSILHKVEFNQIVFAPSNFECPEVSDRQAAELAQKLNEDHGVFVRDARWRGRNTLRISVTAHGTGQQHVERLGNAIEAAWGEMARDSSMI